MGLSQYIVHRPYDRNTWPPLHPTRLAEKWPCTIDLATQLHSFSIYSLICTPVRGVMQQSALFRLLAALTLIFSIAGCGGGSSSSKLGDPATITISPASASLQTGQVLQLSASVQDKNGNVLACLTPNL